MSNCQRELDWLWMQHYFMQLILVYLKKYIFSLDIKEKKSISAIILVSTTRLLADITVIIKELSFSIFRLMLNKLIFTTIILPVNTGASLLYIYIYICWKSNTFFLISLLLTPLLGRLYSSAFHHKKVISCIEAEASKVKDFFVILVVL